ncbi:MAG: isoleucine--tRNA ligase [Candidatus Margulisbacteria bacterium]|nr:isoleucine--tRNA ligase [Candidatus Margulisiibacteriota bacterium]
MEYKKTLNLPQTDFPIRANLAKVEEEKLMFWESGDIYHKILESRTSNVERRYILHDGPPYPNGDIHLGHALNKVLKDIVVKYKSMSGFFAPYIPGWDCHGLPIETQLLKEIRKSGDQGISDIIEFRNKCKEYAMKYVDLQRKEFKKLGVFGEWDKPYLTIDHTYEAKIIELFGILAEKGYVYRGLKPIHWCPTDQTALAEAEIEYEDDRSPSIYVKFEILNPKSEILNKFEVQNPKFKTVLESPWFVVIWTTTPWTLPANVAVAAHPELEYVFLQVGEEVYIVAEGLLEDFVKRLEFTDHKIIDKTKGKFLEGILCQHPFVEREVPIVLGDLVTLEQGTGFVHIAPGHGAEDYQVGLKYKLPIVMPVDGRGYFDDTVPDFIKGKHYDESNKLITEKMKENGSLLKLEFFKHQYPHCWRCKKPVIFRATEQWFISVDKHDMRGQALKAIIDTKWYPAWGENRIRGMVETRPDWCISRQRSWGVPIPAFYCQKCKKPQMTGLFNKAIKELVLKEGTNGWFLREAKDILPAGTKCPDCGGTEFTKETDILDVWFESGSSHAAVLETREELSWPADLYLEGSDQHRGWFQSSLLLGVGYKGRAPFNSVLTHGFTIDDKGKKMSKSLGNVVDPNDVVKRYGADVLRLWVASTDFRNDMAASEKILKQVQEAYLKIRNTCRFLMSNLYDFAPQPPVPSPQSLLEIDRWILLKLNKLIERSIKAYDEFEFHHVYHGLYDFCVNDLSAFYLDMSKDRLYCGGKNSLERTSAQFAMNEILTTLVKLMAPILSFTAEDIHKYLKTQQPLPNNQTSLPTQNPSSIFLLDMPQPNKAFLDNKLEAKWATILEYREKAYRKIEELRASKEIGAAIDAQVELFAKGEELELLKSVDNLLPMVMIVSKVILSEGDKEPVASHAPGKKCERCWTWKEDVGKHADHPGLCGRCHSVIASLL